MDAQRLRNSWKSSSRHTLARDIFHCGALPPQNVVEGLTLSLKELRSNQLASLSLVTQPMSKQPEKVSLRGLGIKVERRPFSVVLECIHQVEKISVGVREEERRSTFQLHRQQNCKT